MISTCPATERSADDGGRELAIRVPSAVVRLHQQHDAAGALIYVDSLLAHPDRHREVLQPPATPRLLITPSEAAFVLSISIRKLWSLTNAGEIPCVRLGRAVRYSPSALQDWIEGQQGTSR